MAWVSHGAPGEAGGGGGVGCSGPPASSAWFGALRGGDPASPGVFGAWGHPPGVRDLNINAVFLPQEGAADAAVAAPAGTGLEGLFSYPRVLGGGREMTWPALT